MEDVFVIDWETATDKRALIKADTFGYLSLHYIASLSPEQGFPAELCNKKVEIQIRTLLQRAWSDVNHDIGYKSDLGVPREVTRAFARVAGLLEIADAEFMRNRDLIQAFGESTRKKSKSTMPTMFY